VAAASEVNVPENKEAILGSSRFRRVQQAFCIAIAILFLFGLWAFWWEPSSLTVVHQIIPVRPWHPEHTGLKVAVMSDLHVGSPYLDLPRLQHVVAVTNAEKPDLIVILGDVVIRGVLGGRFITPGNPSGWQDSRICGRAGTACCKPWRRSMTPGLYLCSCITPICFPKCRNESA